MAEKNDREVQKVNQQKSISAGEREPSLESGSSLAPPSYLSAASSGPAQFKPNKDSEQTAAEFSPSYGTSPSSSKLSGPVLGQMNQAFNADFSGVNVFKNSSQASAAGAKAYAQGSDVHFAPGQYSPQSTSGKELIGHELAHVVQQSQGRVKPTVQAAGMAINDSASLEQEADTQGKSAAKAQPVQKKAGAAQETISENSSQPVVQGWGLGGLLKKVGSAIGGAAKKVGSAVSKGASSAWSGVKSVGKGVVSGAKSVIGGIGSGVKSAAKGVWGGVKSAAKGIGSGVKSAAKGVWGGAKSVAKGAWGGIKSVAGGIKNGAGQVFEGAKNGLASFGGGLVSGAGQAWDGIKGGLSQLTTNPLQAVVTMGGGLWDGLKSVGSGALNGLGDLFSGAKAGLGSLGSGLVGGVKSMASGLVGGLKSVGSGIWTGLKQAASGIGSGAKKVIDGLWTGLKKVGGGIKDGFFSVVGGLLKGGYSMFDALMEIGPGMIENFIGPEGKKVDHKDIPEYHVMMEYLAHTVAYNPGVLNDIDKSAPLTHVGYDIDNYSIRVGPNGFQAVLIQPLPGFKGKLKPILSFRGTLSVQGISTDLDSKQVGDQLYNANLGKISELMALAEGPVDVTGHSLGGAVAQIFTARHPDKVNNLVTFQSPGISAKEANAGIKRMEAMDKSDRPNISHHIVDNDLVDTAGEKNLPGSVFEHRIDDSYSVVDAHTATIFNSPQFNDARKKLGFTDSVMKSLDAEVRDSDAEITEFEGHPNVVRRVVFEAIRKGIGWKTLPMRELLRKLNYEKVFGEEFEDYDSQPANN